MLNHHIIENTHNQPYFQIYVKFLQGGELLTMHVLEPMKISIKSIFFPILFPLLTSLNPIDLNMTPWEGLLLAKDP